MITLERMEELRKRRELLVHQGSASQMKYNGLLTMFNAVCMTGKPVDVESHREMVLSAAGEILDNMYAQHLISRELCGFDKT